MAKENVLLTKEGLESLKKELDDLQNKQRPAILEEIQNARALGDLSENGMYHAAREKQSFIEGRIQELSEVLKRAKVAKNGKKDVVGLGSKVTLETQKGSVEFKIVGPTEVDSSQNKISHESPIGKELVGKRMGDTIEVDAPAGTVKYEIKSVE